MMRVLPTLATLVAIAAGIPLGRAHEGATGIVKERMDAMEAMSRSMKEIKRRLEANRGLTGVEREATRIADIAHRLPSWFPPGSDQAPTEAKAEVWTRSSDFGAEALRLEEASRQLAAVATSGDPASIATQFTAVGRSCGGCHETFRRSRR